MQQMMQKMMAQMTKGNQPGKGNNKAPSPFAGSATEGAAGRGKGGSRSVEKGTGASDAGQWPEEFRDQLQSYFQQLDGVK